MLVSKEVQEECKNCITLLKFLNITFYSCFAVDLHRNEKEFGDPSTILIFPS